MKTDLFDFHLPPQQIAQHPLPYRDASRLLVLDRSTQTWTDATVRDLQKYFRAGDVLVINDTRVIPARLRATRDLSGGKVEFLLLPPEPEQAAIASRTATARERLTEQAAATAPGTATARERLTEQAAAPASGTATARERLTEQAAAPASGTATARERLTRRVLTKAGGILKPGESFTLHAGPKVTLLERLREAGDLIQIHCTAAEFDDHIAAQGEIPLPPYIHRPPGPSADADKDRYQTVYAQNPGAVAAPTAGLHFSPALLAALKSAGVIVAPLTLHVGPGTFRPVKADNVEDHFVDPEPYFIPAETVAAIQSAKRASRRIIAVGTTTLRTLEGSVVDRSAIERSSHSSYATGIPPAQDTRGAAVPAALSLAGQTNLFVHPPFNFKIVDALLTNFHVPKSSLLMLVSAFAAPGSTAGIDFMQRAYRHAVDSGYRFYSYGDACLIL